MDDGPFKCHIERLRTVFAHDRQNDLGAGFTAHQRHGFIEGLPFDLDAVKTDDQVASLQTGLVGRCSVYGCDHPDHTVFQRDFKTQTAKLPMRVDIHFPIGLGVQVYRMGIQPPQHAFDRIIEQLTVRYVFDVVGLDLAENLSKGLEVLHRQNDRVGGALGVHRMTDTRDQPENHTDQGSGQGLHSFTPAWRTIAVGPDNRCKYKSAPPAC